MSADPPSHRVRGRPCAGKQSEQDLQYVMRGTAVSYGSRRACIYGEELQDCESTMARASDLVVIHLQPTMYRSSDCGHHTYRCRRSMLYCSLAGAQLNAGGDAATARRSSDIDTILCTDLRKLSMLQKGLAVRVV